MGLRYSALVTYAFLCKWTELTWPHIHSIHFSLSVLISRTNREGPTWKPHRGWIITAGTEEKITIYWQCTNGQVHSQFFLFFGLFFFLLFFWFLCPWLLNYWRLDWITIRDHSSCPPFLFCAVHLFWATDTWTPRSHYVSVCKQNALSHRTNDHTDADTEGDVRSAWPYPSNMDVGHGRVLLVYTWFVIHEHLISWYVVRLLFVLTCTFTDFPWPFSKCTT